MKPKLAYFSVKLSKRVTRQTTMVFLFAILGVGLVSDIEIGYLSFSNYSRALERTKLQIETKLRQIEAASTTIAKNIPIDIGYKDDLENSTKTILQVDTNIISCAIAFEDNLVDQEQKYCMVYSYSEGDSLVTTLLGKEGRHYWYQDWYQIAKMKREPYWNEPAFDFDNNTIASSYSVPIYDDDGKFVGVLRLAMSLSGLQQIVDSSHAFDDGQDVSLLVSQFGTFIAHEHRYKEKIMNETIFTDALNQGSTRSLDECIKLMNNQSGMSIYPVDGTLRHLQYFALYNGWRLIGICGYDQLFSPIKSILFVLLIIGFIGIIVQFFSLRIIIKRMTTPISLLTYAAMNMSRGNFEATIPNFIEKDETQKLAGSMKLLQKTIIQYIKELKTTTAAQERIESEMNVANTIQMSFLPHNFISNEKCECYASLKPAKSVGGDLYDFSQEGNFFRFAIGDVSGKGIPAAMYMAITKSSFNFLKGIHLGTSGVTSRINDAFSDGNEEGMFVTLFVAKIDLDTYRMDFCNGGHNPIIVVDPDGTAQYIKCKSNIAVGLFPGFPFEAESIQLKKGSRVIAYTDGITEAENKAKELFGEERLLDFASNLRPGITSREVVEGIIEKVREFTDGNEQNDDMTIFTVRV